MVKLTLRVPEELRDLIEQRAEAAGLSMNQWLLEVAAKAAHLGSREDQRAAFEALLDRLPGKGDPAESRAALRELRDLTSRDDAHKRGAGKRRR